MATSITVTPAAVTLTSINATQTLTGKVFSQSGDSMPGATITWSSSATGVATVVASTGLVTAVSNGTATITATSGSITKDITVTVAQAVASLTQTGNNQTGTVGAALATPISVRARDAGGTAVVGINVAFAVTGGAGNVGNATVPTNATGDASTTWTLGTVSGTLQSATATAGTVVAPFTATGNAGAAATATIQAGNNQTRTVGTSVATPPSVKITDAFGNAKVGVNVDFTPTAGGGSVTGGTKTTDVAGIATVTSWTMGAAPGINTLQASVQGTAVTVNINATAVAAGAATNIAVVGGNNQTALVGYPTNIRPSVLLTDATAAPVAGVQVTFAVTGGGGSVTSATVNTNAQGIAQVGWTVGAGAGANTMTATAAGGGIANNPITFTATGAAAAFNVVIQNIGPAFSAQVQAAFDSATAFWQRTIYGDIADITGLTINAGQCNSANAIGPVNVDDVLILARFDSIDGPGQVLGSAGPCFVRTTGRLTIAGSMRFDTADVAGLINNGSLNAVIRHEMGHVLGFGTLWTQTQFNCLQNASGTGNVLDTYFSCPKAQSAFDSIGGTNYTGGLKVPVENCGPASPAGCGAGTVNGHWREPTFFNEMMTGYLNGGGPNPASVLTIAAMEDLAYVVNYGAAEVYNRVFTVGTPSLTAMSAAIDLRDDVYRGPIYLVDRNGRVVGMIPRP